MPSWTKQQLVLKAFGATGIVEYDGTDMQPEMLQDGLSSLDAMMAEWDSRGIRPGYLGSTTPTEGDLGQDSGLPVWAIRAVYTNLAIELAASLGREVSPRIAGIAANSYAALAAVFAGPVPMRLPPNMPAGAGHKGWPSRGFSILNLSAEDDDDLDGSSDPIDPDLDFG